MQLVFAPEQSYFDPIGYRLFRGIFNEFWPTEYESNKKLVTIDVDSIVFDGIVSQKVLFKGRKQSDIERLTLGKTLYRGHHFLTLESSRHIDTTDMICKEVFHLFGDPGMVFHTQKPQIMSDVSFEIKKGNVGSYGEVLLNEPALIGFFNESKGTIGRYFGSSLKQWVSSNDNYTFIIQRYNHVPFTIHVKRGLVFTSAPLVSTNNTGSLAVTHSNPGLIKALYTLASNEMNINSQIELRDWDNRLIETIACTETEGEVTISSPQIQTGYYVLTLKEPDKTPVYKKVIVK